MANVSVSVQTAASGAPVNLRPLLANQSPTTQISWRLAKKLGIKVSDTKDVLIEDMCFPGPFFKWKLSMVPITVTFRGVKSENIYPVINCTANGGYWEMIIGSDCLNFNYMVQYGFDDNRRPTPGPGFDRNVMYMGHSVRIVRDGDRGGGGGGRLALRAPQQSYFLSILGEYMTLPMAVALSLLCLNYFASVTSR
jgi:hypothetical protein